MRSVLSAEGVPISSAPSGPTKAITLPVLVANTTTLAVISVIPAVSCALPAPANHKAISSPSTNASRVGPQISVRPRNAVIVFLQGPAFHQFPFSFFRFLFQQTVHFHLFSRTEIHVSIHQNRNHKPRRQSRAVALAVLLRTVDRLAQVGRVERIEHTGVVR